jgi:MFS transporter, putative metabolite:H+ symporter
VCASYINEIAPTATRGRFFSVFQFLMISGYAIAAIASSLIVEQYGWRTMFVIGAVPLLIVPFALLLLPESPRWLARMGRWDAALGSVATLGGPATPARPAGDEFLPPRSRLSDLLARDVRAMVGVLVLLWFLTSLVNFGLTNWVPSIYVSAFGIPVSDALRFSSVAVILVLFVPLLLGAVMDRIGRRPLAIAGTLAGGVVLLSLLLAGSNIPLVVTLVALGHTGIGIGTVILWPYSAEAFPTRVRALALGVCSAAARTASMLTPVLVGTLIATTGSVNPVFGLFGALGLVVAAIWFFATRETAGTRIDEVTPP